MEGRQAARLNLCPKSHSRVQKEHPQELKCGHVFSGLGARAKLMPFSIDSLPVQALSVHVLLIATGLHTGNPDCGFGRMLLPCSHCEWDGRSRFFFLLERWASASARA